jgi:hypothetical protein
MQLILYGILQVLYACQKQHTLLSPHENIMLHTYAMDK